MILTPEQRLAALLGGEPTPPKESKGTYLSRSQSQEVYEALKGDFSREVTILDSPFQKAASERGANVPKWRRDPLAVGLAMPHNKDAHVAPLNVVSLIEGGRAPRVNGDAIKLGAGIDYLFFDYDLPKTKSGARGFMTPELFREKIARFTAHPVLSGAVFYSTRGGLRAVVPLAKSFELNPHLKGADWAAFYDRIRSTLPDDWDHRCNDATRLFRLPFVRRATYDERGKVQSTEEQNGEIWIPSKIRSYELSPEDLAVIVSASVKGNARRDGVKGDRLVSFFERIGLLGPEYKEINGEKSYVTTCPLEKHHSSDNETSTLLHAVEGGGYVLNCMHATCSQIFEERGGWRAYLQAEHAEEWREIIGREDLDYLYDPYDHLKFVEQVVEILEATFPDRIFRRQDAIMTIERGVYGGARWRSWSVADLCGLVNRVARWSQAAKDGETRRTTVPERMIKIHLLAIAEELPQCETATTLPPLDPKTMTVTRFSEGYCPITQSYYLPAPSIDLDKLRRACEGEVDENAAICAYLDLVDLFDDFPWRAKKHRVLAAALVLTVALRRSMDVAPLLFVSANNKGAGKTKLLSAAAAAVHGTTPPLSSLPSREEELKKHLDALVHTDADFCVFDNVASKIGGATLDAFITSPVHSYRPLGATDIRLSANRVFLGATGNNATLSGDTDRRTLMIRLVTELEDPSTRTGFRYPDLIKEARERVTRTWCAIITILRAWGTLGGVDRRHALEGARPFGSFEQWVSMVRDPLMWVSGLVEGEALDVVALSREEVDTAQEDNRTEVFDILWDWQQQEKSGGAWSAKELFTAVKRSLEDDEGSELASIGATLPRFSLYHFSRLIGSRRDQVSGALKMTAKKVRGQIKYLIVSTEAAHVAPVTVEPDPFVTRTQPDETPRDVREELPVLNFKTACDDAQAHEVPERLVKKRPQYEGLSRRCLFLRGDMCLKNRVPCEFMGVDGGAEGGISQPTATALEENLEAALEEVDAPPLIPLDSLDSPRAIEIIRAEFEVKTTQDKIAKRLNSEGIAPPNGRKWTSAKVGQLARRHQITRPKKQPETKKERIMRTEGHWVGYWPTDHPLTTPSSRGEGRAQKHHGTRRVDASALLAQIYGEAIDCRGAFNRRIIREEDA